MTAAEKRSIEAVARVHRDTGIPISTHCVKGTMGMDQLRLLEKHGVDPKNVLLWQTKSTLIIIFSSRNAANCRKQAQFANPVTIVFFIVPTLYRKSQQNAAIYSSQT